MYQREIAPNEKKLIWYKLSKKLPDVSPLKNSEAAATPRGEVKSAQSIVAKPPKAAPGKQMIWLQAPTLHLQEDIKMPNLIAFAPIAAPPPVARPKPKAFIPPPDRPRPKSEPAPLLSDAPQVESTQGVLRETPKELGNVMAGIAKAKRPVKAFVPPSPATGASRNSARPVLDAGSAPAIPGGSMPETFTAAVIGLQPSPTLERIPEGSRAAQLSMGPNKGAAASGSGGNGSGGAAGSGGFRIPDVSIRGGGKPGEGEPGAQSNRGVEYQQTILQTGRSMLSVPLRPSSRSIPASVEARFQGRNVYTLVIPIPKLPQYSGDWIIWFAEREQGAGNAPQIRAPMPAKKIDKAADATLDRLEGRVQLTGILGKDGHLASVSVIKSFDPRINQSAVEDLQKWEFTPALRDDVPFDVDIVIEIPFRLAAGS